MNHIYFYNKGGFDDLMPRLEISINMDISILGFYRYIKNISKISMGVLIKMSIKQKLFKIHGNVWKKLPKNDKIRRNTYIKVIV